ncbi:MAG: TlpA family protein disulfide reductase [Thermodesulfovibrionales bacterium]|nr:TlpA family protein disulfide reductase [Thermodesulfovibrionales bacterium]
MKTIKSSILIAAIILGLAGYCPLPAAENQSPDFETKDIAGKAMKLSELKGKVVLLDFWATWCPPCRVEIPNLLGIFRQFKNRNFVLISVSLDRDLQAARKFVKDKEMDWVHIIDMEAGREIATLYQVEYIPSTFIIGRKGNIEARQLRGDELKDKIASLLK